MAEVSKQYRTTLACCAVHPPAPSRSGGHNGVPRVAQNVDRDSAADFLAGGGELGALLRAHDWTTTSLGHPTLWPQSLRMAIRIMLTSLQPIWIGWGKDLIYFYNDPYKSIIGGKHPWAIGRPTLEVWREIWDDIGPMLEKALGGEQGTYVESQLLIMERNGYPEETYYTFSYSPIPNDDGTVGGIFCANSDDTERSSANARSRCCVNLPQIPPARAHGRRPASGASRRSRPTQRIFPSACFTSTNPRRAPCRWSARPDFPPTIPRLHRRSN